jgi:hypothetical protein
VYETITHWYFSIDVAVICCWEIEFTRPIPAMVRKTSTCGYVNNPHFGVETIIPTVRLLFLETHESIMELLEANPGFQGSRNNNLPVSLV